MLQELFFGFDLPDLLHRYADTVVWHSISLEMVDGSELPVFIAGQYQPREFLLGWYIDAQEQLLASLGMFRDAREHTVGVLDALQGGFGQAGLRVSLI